MRFEDPLWLLAGLIACGALAWAWRRYDARQRAALAAFASPHLHDQLTASVSTVARKLRRGLFLAAVAALFAALARPQAGLKWEEIKRRGIEILFAVDTSRSMRTPDVKPDRLTRAKLAVDDFVSRLNGDGAGLIAFAGDAFLQCPITLDYEAFHESLAALNTDTIPRGGTDIASAIAAAQTALQNRPGKEKILVLLTDGEDLQGNALAAAKTAAKHGVKIYAVGVGTPNGDLIPIPSDQGGGFLKDEDGRFVKSHLDEAGLKAIAAATGGLYEPLGAQGQGLDTIYREALAPLKRHDLASRRERVYTERFQWPLAAALAFLLASLPVGTRRRHPRRPGLPPLDSGPEKTALGVSHPAAIACLLLLIPWHQAKASPASSAENAYRKGDFARAEKEYEAAAQSDAENPDLQFNAGTAAYKAGRFPQAASSFQNAIGGKPSANPKRLAAQENAFYDLGNTLYRAGQKTEQAKPDATVKAWEQAVKTYDAALQLRPTDPDAKYNRDFVQKKLNELKKQQKQKHGKQDQQGKNQEDKHPQQKSGQKGDNGQRNKDQKNGQQKQSGENQEHKPAQSKPPQPSNSGEKPSRQKQPEQDKAQPKSAPQGNPDANRNRSSADNANPPPGQMSPEEARALLDSLKNEEHRLPASPLDRENDESQSDQPIKDW